MKENLLFYTHHVQDEKIGDANVVIYFYSDKTYRCGHWSEDSFWQWDMQDGRLMWRADPTHGWGHLSLNNLAELLEAEIFLNNLFSS